MSAGTVGRSGWLAMTALAIGSSAAPLPGQGRGHVAADAAFMRAMIAHHGQALEMTALVGARSRNDGVRLLAERIEVSQVDEIRLMRQWLTDRREAPDGPAKSPGHGDHHTAMPGMLTPAELAELRASRDSVFDRLFLGRMIRHHEGAVTMVTRLFETPGAGQDAEIFRFASDVLADQRAEIARMRTMLERLSSSGG